MGSIEVDAKIKGADNFANRLEDVYDRVVERTDDELRAATDTLLKAAQGFAPVDTGQYRDSLRKGRIGQVFTDNDYAGVIEFATEYVRDPEDRRAHTVTFGSNLAAPPRVIYRALGRNVRGISDDFFDAMVEEFQADGWLEG